MSEAIGSLSVSGYMPPPNTWYCVADCAIYSITLAESKSTLAKGKVKLEVLNVPLC